MQAPIASDREAEVCAPTPVVRIAPAGVFDLASAVALERASSRLTRDVLLELDFAAVTRVEDRALWHLAQALQRFPDARVQVPGMTAHQHLVLRYLMGR